MNSTRNFNSEQGRLFRLSALTYETVDHRGIVHRGFGERLLVNLFYCVEQMPRGEFIGSLELIVLLALVRLGENAYGMTVRREIEARTGRDISIGAVYATLERLEAKGYAPRIEADGEAALRASQEAIRKMATGLRKQWGTT